MISKIRHIGLYIHYSELKETKQFYIDLGFEIFYEGDEKYPVFGDIHVIKLKTKNGEVLELVVCDEMSHPEGSHMALQVDNLDDVYKKLKKNNDSFFIKPMLSNDGTAKVAFCYDPCGFMLELVEIL